MNNKIQVEPIHEIKKCLERFIKAMSKTIKGQGKKDNALSLYRIRLFIILKK